MALSVSNVQPRKAIERGKRSRERSRESSNEISRKWGRLLAGVAEC